MKDCFSNRPVGVKRFQTMDTDGWTELGREEDGQIVFRKKPLDMSDIVFRPPIHSDLPAVAALLTPEGFGDDHADRLCTPFDRPQIFSLVA
jgi:hypothetical protein